MEKLIEIFNSIKTVHPYVHHITNGVTMTDCANITLAAGGSPAMAHSIHEVADMVANMHALVLNTGTPDEFQLEAMLIAGKKANELGIPIVLDPVAVGATPYRKKINAQLMEEINFTVIRGNASEIMTLTGVSSGRGVDAMGDVGFDEEKVMALAHLKKTVIAASGAVDFITDGKQKAYCHNGIPMLSEITGTGCMSASVMGVCISASDDTFESVLLAAVMMGLAGEVAFAEVEKKRQLGTFHMKLLDAMSSMTAIQLQTGGNVSYER